MMPQPQNLTKSRFKLGCECATKLYYCARREQYYDAMGEDSFMAGLAEGGYQVGEYAKWIYCKDPVQDVVRSLNREEALAETAQRLDESSATIAEAAFLHKNLFMRADIVVKDGSVLNLYEVKSKSWQEEDSFWTRRAPRKLASAWEPYLLDVAFQKYVLQGACPNFQVKAHLILLDKGRQTTVDRLNQMFPVFRENGRPIVKPSISGKEELGGNILAEINVDQDIQEILSLPFDLPDRTAGTFVDLISRLAGICNADKPFNCGVGSKCKTCQYRFPSDPKLAAELQTSGFKSGREECWARVVGAGYDGSKPKVIELWNYRKTDERIAERKFYLADLEREDIGGGKQSDRQWMQVEKVKKGDLSPWLDRDGLRTEMSRWKYPLHFIDFETSRMALPMLSGMPPYMQVAFQFSHHTVDTDCQVRHAGQWIEVRPGMFPSYEFVRTLKRQLEQDEGTIFRYATHENSVLRDIHIPLSGSSEPDRNELMRWIDGITEYTPEGQKEKIKGARNMVDMRELVVGYHYDPATHGSNSLKYVLPAIIKSSDYLRGRYGRSLEENEVGSLNFPPNWIWVPPSAGNNPYDSLPPIFPKAEEDELSEHARGLDDIDDGGAATLAYAKLQFFDLPDKERTDIRNALLRYCELDTLAMVMLYEYWQSKLSP